MLTLQCGACTTYAVAHAIEALFAIQRGITNIDWNSAPTISEDGFLACLKPGNYETRCSGTWVTDVYAYARSTGFMRSDAWLDVAGGLLSCCLLRTATRAR
jgi:hypothetical protein